MFALKLLISKDENVFFFTCIITLGRHSKYFFLLGIINQKYIKCKRWIDLSAVISCEIFNHAETEVHNRFLRN